MGDLDGGILILLRGKQDCYGCEDQYNMVCKTLMAILRERQGGGGLSAHCTFSVANYVTVLSSKYCKIFLVIFSQFPQHLFSFISQLTNKQQGLFHHTWRQGHVQTFIQFLWRRERTDRKSVV